MTISDHCNTLNVIIQFRNTWVKIDWLYHKICEIDDKILLSIACYDFKGVVYLVN